MPTGGDCMAIGSVAKSNEEQPKRLPYNFTRTDDAVESAVLSGKPQNECAGDSARYSHCNPL
jgi:hypothetical protein